MLLIGSLPLRGIHGGASHAKNVVVRDTKGRLVQSNGMAGLLTVAGASRVTSSDWRCGRLVPRRANAAKSPSINPFDSDANQRSRFRHWGSGCRKSTRVAQVQVPALVRCRSSYGGFNLIISRRDCATELTKDNSEAAIRFLVD